MRISFVLPSRSPVPIGAFRVVYAFANHLVERGNEVMVVHPRTVRAPSSTAERAKAALWVRRYRRRPAELAPWFELDPRVHLLPMAYLDPDALPDADAAIAVTWEPPLCVAAAPPSKGRGFYLIQEGVPEPVATPAAVDAAWDLPLHKLVISTWLEEKAIARGEGAATSRVPIGVDLDAWGIDVPPAGRGPSVAAFLNPLKGQAEIVTALASVKESVPGLAAACFGTVARPAELPAWCDYTELPDRPALRRIYNSCAIFLQAGREEGWGLPANEAMACGCALVTYDNGGSRDYAFDGETARVVARHGADELAAALGGLLADDALRVELARKGAELVAGFTWERSVDALEAALR
jgi:glycosyltransferase involved in cell wall biosynthesis